jgi:DNA primase
VIPDRTIEEIKAKADVLNIVSQYVQLKKRGRNYLGLCPFHQEKTPSFTVSPEKDLWHCFGCGEGGHGVLSFVMKIENLNFAEAVKFLGEKVGVAVLEEKTTAYRVKADEKELLYAVCVKARDFFQDQLRAGGSEAARQYLQRRGITDELISGFNLGYAPDNWDSLLKTLTQQGYSQTLLERAGLIIKREDNSGYYDRFRGRVICTVTDTRNRPVAFGGRILEAGEPKYLNSPETPIFSKGKLLYAFAQAAEEIRRTKVVIVTEGYMDTIACHQFGFKNAVATLGTALTEDQAKLLGRYVQEVILAYDADNAGQTATERGIAVLREAGLEVKVTKLQGKDPDEMLRKEGREAFAMALSQAVPYIKYLLDRAIEKVNIATPEGKHLAAEAAAKILGRIEQEVLRHEYIRYTAENLKIKEDLLLSMLNRSMYYSARKTGSNVARVITRPSSSREDRAQELILKAGFENIEIRQKVIAEVGPEDFSAGVFRELFMILKEYTGEGLEWLENIGNEQVRALARQLLLKEEPWTQKIIEDCIKVLHNIKNRQDRDTLQAQLGEAEARGDHVAAKEILTQLQMSNVECRMTSAGSTKLEELSRGE